MSFNNPDRGKIEQWFEQGDWLQKWNILPDPTIDMVKFSSAHSRNPELWNKAFRFLESSDLKKIETGNYNLDGDNLLVKVQEYITKEEEDTMYEAHRKYADIQYIISGNERIGVARLENTAAVIPYDDLNDIVFLRSKEDKYHVASPDTFFIFLPQNAHRPCVKNGSAALVKKIVIKVRVD